MRRGDLHREIRGRVAKSRRQVFLRADFSDLSRDYDQIGRALKRLVDESFLVKLGYGLYARAHRSRISGKIVPAVPLPSLGREALKRLNVKQGPSSAQRAYNEGRSTQVPTGRVIGVRKRVSRRIGFGGVYLSYERL